MYDTILIPCPWCGEINGEQTKQGACMMEDFNLSEAPAWVLEAVNGLDARCYHCDKRFSVEAKVEYKTSYQVKKLEG